MLKQCIKYFAVCICFWVLTGAVSFAAPAPHSGETMLPFSIGEKLHYTVRWEMVRAGKATFTVLDFSKINGKKAWHFLLDVKSSRYVDIFYKIRDRMEGFADTGLKRSLLYKKVQSGKDKKKIAVAFDWEKSTVTYSNFGGKKPPLPIPSNTVDPLSAFYKMRTLDFEVEKNFSFAVTDGKKQFIQKGEVIKKEILSLPSGTWETHLLVPQVNHFSGVFKKSENPTLKLWVTADNKKIPVRIKVKVFIGSVIFDLASIKN